MQKTKLGISVGLLGAALYFLGALSIIPAFLLAGYVLLMEDNEWLKKTAVKMVIMIIVFNILYLAVGMVQNVFDSLDIIFGWITPFRIDVPLNLDQLARIVLVILRDLILIISGFNALTMGTIKSKFMDNIINKHM